MKRDILADHITIISWLVGDGLIIIVAFVLFGVLSLFLFRHFVRKRKKIDLTFSRSIWMWVYMAVNYMLPRFEMRVEIKNAY